MGLLAGIRVTAYLVQDSGAVVKVGDAITDANGEFSIGGVAEGNYFLKFEDIGSGGRSAGTYGTFYGGDPAKGSDAVYSISDAKNYVKLVNNNWDFDLWYMYLASGGAISGTLRCYPSYLASYLASGYIDSSGNIAGMLVEALRLNGDGSATAYGSTTTISNGTFSIGGLPGGNYVLRVSDSGVGARPPNFFETTYLGDSSKSGDDVNWHILSGVSPYFITPPFNQTYFLNAGISISGTISGE